MLLLHITAKHLNPPSTVQQPTSIDLAPSVRVMAVLIMLMAIAMTPQGQWLSWMFYWCCIVAVLQVARIDFLRLCQRLSIEFAFAGVMIVGTVFRSGGAVLWQWGWITITTEGLVTLGSVSCKFALSLLLLNLLTMTTPIPQLIQALEQLRVPPLLVAILASMYRYLGLLIEEFATMKRAAIARNLTTHPHWHRLVLGNMIGSLFIRTYDRGDRIHKAMMARGYEGHLPKVASVPWRSQDFIFLGCTLGLALLGQFFS